MNRKRVAIGLVLGFVMAVTIGRAEALKIPYNGTYSGSFLDNNTQIDTNGDGVKATSFTYAANTNLGRVTGQAVFETSSLPAPVTCPEGNLEYTVALDLPIERFPNGDLLFYETPALTLCFDPNTGTFSISYTTTIIGGTGKFAGATGSIEGNSPGGYLFYDPVSGQGFGYFTGEFTGTIITPD